MKNTFKILERLKESYIKRRVLIVSFVIQNLILSLIVLMYANMIISNARLNGEIDYVQVRIFYNMVIFLLFVIVSIYSPFLLSNSLNTLCENNIIEHLLAVRINIKEIVFAVFLRGVSTLLILLISAFPIVSISFYFGGFSLAKIIRLLVIILSYSVFISSVCIFISTIIYDKNVSIIIAYIVSFILAIINLINLNIFLYSFTYTIIYAIALSILSLVLISSARNTTIFNT